MCQLRWRRECRPSLSVISSGIHGIRQVLEHKGDTKRSLRILQKLLEHPPSKGRYTSTLSSFFSGTPEQDP